MFATSQAWGRHRVDAHGPLINYTCPICLIPGVEHHDVPEVGHTPPELQIEFHVAHHMDDLALRFAFFGLDFHPGSSATPSDMGRHSGVSQTFSWTFDEDQDPDAVDDTTSTFEEELPAEAEADLDDLWESIRNRRMHNFGEQDMIKESMARAYASDRKSSTVYQRIRAPGTNSEILEKAVKRLFDDRIDKQLVQVKVR